MFGPYDPVPNWPRPLGESLPDHQAWTWSQSTDVFPESPDRVFVTQKGELPVLRWAGRGTTWLPQIGPSIKFPVGGGVPMRETASATPSGGKAAADGSDGRPGVDWRWEHVIVVFDRNGKIIERLVAVGQDLGPAARRGDQPVRSGEARLDRGCRQPLRQQVHARRQAAAPDAGHAGRAGHRRHAFRRPTFMAFMDANTWYLADGYDNTRVIKYDMNGKKLLQWGMKGTPPNEKRPGYFNSVHGIAVDPTTRRVYVNDRNNGRMQVFDENGKFLDQWDFGPRPPMNIHSIYMGNDGILWAADQGSNKLLGYDANGHFLYSWGTFGTCQGCSGACTGSRPTRRAISTPPK